MLVITKGPSWGWLGGAWTGSSQAGAPSDELAALRDSELRMQQRLTEQRRRESKVVLRAAVFREAPRAEKRDGGVRSLKLRYAEVITTKSYAVKL